MTTYNAAEVASRLEAHSGWRQAADGYLETTFRVNDFAHAMLFANAVGYLAEKADHHPDIAIHEYKKVTLRVMSHDVGGITERDLALVVAIDGLPGASDARA